MLLSHINKKFAFCVLLTLSSLSLNASETCEKKALDITTNSVVTLNEILVQLSNDCKFSMVVKDQIASEELLKNINGINIKNKSLLEIFNILISGNNLNYTFKNGTLIISALQTKTFKIDYITGVREGTANMKASTDSSPFKANTSREAKGMEDNMISTVEKFNFWENISKEIAGILNNGTEKYQAIEPIINQNAGLITVTGMKSQINRVQKYIDDMQKRLKRQVMLDVNIIEVRLKNGYSKGVDWSKFDIGFNSYLNKNPNDLLFGFGGGEGRKSFLDSFSNGVWTARGGLNVSLNIDGVINFLETKGKTKTISSPKVMTLNNQQALISVGSVINYKLEKSNKDKNGETESGEEQYSLFLGILLNITPEISDDNKIMLRINPSISSFKYEKDDQHQLSGRKIAPDTLERKLSTVITVNDGDTIILGGMIGQSNAKDNNNVPVLGSIPVIGNLFKSSKDLLETTELVFIITPRIMDMSKDYNMLDSLKELGFSKSLYNHE
ncbi:pilus (MSHA type) biogenesis protein MshL [Campylobacter sp. FMV-PI01]|uniref:Pilus (MSHA type) biogenesis protein MshL n=1 Tax=Campylobacter portucalensis TaxID=2608384 RepID=A0A6L5WI00_9BACT|nr:pilus (MSHA type) biogenesis protein MshL [Campylobacter portucalensis]MSN96749.1 pilus (MSHA type) biogenesis protein MshL [Campylobacter portucalensis]